MGFSVDVSVSALTVFVQGLLSFFSPCVLPLLPLYIGYLSGGTGVRGEDGVVRYDRKKVLFHTFFFVLGVSFAFVLLGLGASALGLFFRRNQLLFARLGGILVVLFGLYQLGVFKTSWFLSRERRLPFRLDRWTMSPLTALVMGFTFSFAWTPCVGPAMTSVLLMAASTATRWAGAVLMGVYTLGFVLPFLAVGVFTTGLLAFVKSHGSVVRYTVKAGGALMVVMGLLMFSGGMERVTGWFARLTSQPAVETVAPEPTLTPEPEPEPEAIPAPDFTLVDQFGETHSLADYEGKTIFLNFSATWCSPCRAEMPEIQKLYEEYSREGEDALIVLGVAGPGIGQEGTEEEITDFLEENGYTYPVLMDPEGSLFADYGIRSFPTTFMIDREGNVFGYLTGQMTYEIMEDIVEQTMTGERK